MKEAELRAQVQECDELYQRYIKAVRGAPITENDPEKQVAYYKQEMKDWEQKCTEYGIDYSPSLKTHVPVRW